MGRKKNTAPVFTKEKLLALAEKYGLDYKQYDECFYFFLPKLGIIEDENDEECRDDLFDWSEGQRDVLIYTSYTLHIGVRNGWEAQFDLSEEVNSMERLESIVSYMVNAANAMKELNKKVLELNLIQDISKDF